MDRVRSRIAIREATTREETRAKKTNSTKDRNKDANGQRARNVDNPGEAVEDSKVEVRPEEGSSIRFEDYIPRLDDATS
jgi:hypothetical protein